MMHFRFSPASEFPAPRTSGTDAPVAAASPRVSTRHAVAGRLRQPFINLSSHWFPARSTLETFEIAEALLNIFVLAFAFFSSFLLSVMAVIVLLWRFGF